MDSKIERLATVLLGEPTSTFGHEWRYGTHGSLSVLVGGPNKGSFFDHERGHGGDALSLVVHSLDCMPRKALEWAKAFLDLPPGVVLSIRQCPVASPQSLREASGTVDLARLVWRQSVDPHGTLVEVYLASRGLALEPDLPIRFHPLCRRGPEHCPAMVALMTDPVSGEPCGVHRTFLAHDGSGKAPGHARALLGNAGVVRLVPNGEVTIGLGIAEGIETALSIMRSKDWRPVWAATSAGAIRTFPILPGIEALTIFADGDAAGQGAAETCAKRWREGRRQALIISAPAGYDFNDVLTGAAA